MGECRYAVSEIYSGQNVSEVSGSEKLGGEGRRGIVSKKGKIKQLRHFTRETGAGLFDSRYCKKKSSYCNRLVFWYHFSTLAPRCNILNTWSVINAFY